MNIDTLIAELQKVRATKGNIEVVFGSFCDTNNGFVSFVPKDLNPESTVEDRLTGEGKFSLSIDPAPSFIEGKKKGVADMERLGYTYYRSQFVTRGEMPQSGLSPCQWHNLW